MLHFANRFMQRKRFYKSVSKSLPQCNIKVIFQSKNQLSSLFSFKDSILLYLRSHLIYKCQCINCSIACYGETEVILELLNIEVRLRLREKYHCLVNQVTCVNLRISRPWMMSHASLNVWLKNLYL